MASLSAALVAKVAEVAHDFSNSRAPTDLAALIASLRASEERVFTSEQLDVAEAATASLSAPVEERPSWPTTASRGMFFVFEGLDRSGKSTQSKLLAKHLETVGPVKWMCFPNRETATGMLIDLYLRKKIDLPDEAIHLLFSANRWEASRMIVDELGRGTHVVCDRYAFSGVAYSAAKGLDFEWCRAPDVGLPTPDGVFYLHVTPSEGAKRSAFGDERYENTAMQTRVREEFKRPALKERVAWRDVDGSREVGVIHDEIKATVDAIRLAEQENGHRPIARLWVSE
ncbi:hypothetical protein AB1Y20_019580 [Prymnesium parvum]|uniref:Thymidylate kinase n=1 Tax=Prymnesium parvum TaxID=97485 RepID=A0AB34JVH0_PRYPA